MKAEAGIVEIVVGGFIVVVLFFIYQIFVCDAMGGEEVSFLSGLCF